MMVPLTDQEVQRIRARTPAANAFVHLNHASTSLPDTSVFGAEQAFLSLESQVGTHRAVERLDEVLKSVPEAVATLIGVRPHQIAFTESASRGWALALSAAAPRRRLQVFVCAHEWSANLINMAAQSRISVVKMEGEPQANWAAEVQLALQQRDPECVPVVSMPIISSASGIVHDLHGVAEAVHEADGWFFVDASQAVGQMPVNASDLGADVLVFPARKWLRGPRGIAVLALSDRALEHFDSPALLDIHGSRLEIPEPSGRLARSAGDASRFQAYEHHPALRLGLQAAVMQARELDLTQVHAHLTFLSRHLMSQLQERMPARLPEPSSCGIVCMQMPDTNQTELVAELWRGGINVAAVTARYVPLALGGIDQPASVLRISPHVMTLTEELDRVVNVLASGHNSRPRFRSSFTRLIGSE